jgi:hypothetical protein
VNKKSKTKVGLESRIISYVDIVEMRAFEIEIEPLIKQRVKQAIET